MPEVGMARTERFEMRVDEEILERIDRWRGSQDDVPSRAEATRRLIELGLASSVETSDEIVKFSDGERVLILMMRDLYKRLKVEEAEVDADFLADAIYGGHYWAPKWEMSGVFHGEEDDPSDVHFVGDVLDMWSQIERSYERLDEKEKARIAREAEPFGKDVRLRGFDGNNESSLLGIANFFIKKMGRFEEFRGRDLNSHFPSVDIHKRMLAVYAPMEKMLVGRGLNADQIIQLLQAQAYRATEP
ncbi:MAG TPA: YfbU family protein [Thermoanaerobaculia bacterium]